jgi:fido (protein-threonine AMPylation protein)
MPYSTGSDPYLDAKSGVLRNKFNFSNQAELDDAESRLITVEMVALLNEPVPSYNQYNLALLR